MGQNSFVLTFNTHVYILS